MAEYLIQEETLTEIADAVREISGIEEEIKLKNLASIIKDRTYSNNKVLEELLNLKSTEITNEEIITILPSFFQANNEELIKVELPNVPKLRDSTFTKCKNLTTVDFTSVSSMGADNFSQTAIDKIYMPNLKSITSWGWNFQLCTQLTKAYFPKLENFTPSDFAGCRRLTTLILGSETICTIPSINVLNETPIAGDTTQSDGIGYIYVPAKLIEEYKVATNWIEFSSCFRAIEDYPEVLEGWE